MRKLLLCLASFLFGVLVPYFRCRRYLIRKEEQYSKISQKNMKMFLLAKKWMYINKEGNTIERWLLKNEYHSVAIYGMSYIADILIEELKDSGIEICYGIDKNVTEMYSGIRVFKPSDRLANVDVMVVTPISFFDEIKRDMETRVMCPIISIEDIVYECLG